MKMETEYESRLAELAAAWFRLAAELDVYLQYEFTGATSADGQEAVLETVDALVAQAIRITGASEEREERWLNLTVDRQPERIRLVCASSGACPVELAPLAKMGAEVAVRQFSDIYEVTVGWSVHTGPRETAGDGSC